MSTPQTLKDKDLQDYYDALFEMYSTPGWQKLMEDVAHMRQVHESVRTVTDERTLLFRHGELNQMDWLFTHQERTESAYALALEEDGGEPEAPTGGVAKIVQPDIFE